ncbi:MAG: CarD family transcriptional regulator [Brevinematia bacterium]
MFGVGDKVFYPFHGAGEISEIKEKEVLGSKNIYYEIFFPLTGTKISVPANNAEKIFLRPISTEKKIKEGLKYLASKEIYIESNWKNRYAKYQSLLKSGELNEMFEVLKSLYFQNKRKEISISEKRLYNQTLNLITSEITLSLNKNPDDVKKEIIDILSKLEESIE